MRELDALLMRFADDRYARLGRRSRRHFGDFLALPDPEILGLLTGRVSSDDPAFNRIVGLVLEQRLS